MKNTNGFVAGTLVHTDNGLIPIQAIKVGDKVLSKPESGVGELVCSRVVKTIKSAEKHPIMTPLEGIYCTENPPFWVRKYNNYGTGKYNKPTWMAAEYISKDDEVYSLAHGYGIPRDFSGYTNVEPRYYERALGSDPYHIGGLYLIATDNPHVALYIDGYEYRDDLGETHKGVIDFSTGEPVEIFTNNRESYLYYNSGVKSEPIAPRCSIRFLDKNNPEHRADIDKYADLLYRFRYPWESDDYGYPVDIDYEYNATAYTDYVYNMEVEGNHTYFVEHDGVWVHS